MPDQTPEPLTDDQLRELIKVEYPDDSEDHVYAHWLVAQIVTELLASRDAIRKFIDARARDMVAEEAAQAEPVSLPSDAALADLRARLVADGVVPAPMPEPESESLTDDDLREIANGQYGDHLHDWVIELLAAELLDRRVRHLRALSLIHHLMRSRGSWMVRAARGQSTARYVKAVAAGNATVCDEAMRWAAWFAAESAHWQAEAGLYHTVAAQNYETDGASVAALDAERTGLQDRVDELSAGQGELIEKLSAASARVAALDTDLCLTRDELRDSTARIAELEAAQATPDAYIAVKRYHSPNTDGPAWEQPAAVFPAGDDWALDREDFAAEGGWEFLPIVAVGDGTRAVTAQPDPVGFAVTVRSGDCRWMQTGPMLLDREAAADRASWYQTHYPEQDARAVELREVRDA